MAFNNIKDGEFTKTIYTMVTSALKMLSLVILIFYLLQKIKDERYIDAIGALVTIVDANPMVSYLLLNFFFE